MMIKQSAFSCRFVMSKGGFTLIELMVACFIISLLAGLSLAAVQAAREASRRITCANNLRMINLGMQHYLSETSCFPPMLTHTDMGIGTQNLSAHSFSPLARMLSHLDQQSLFNATNFTNIPDFPAGSQQNLTVMKCSVSLFLCPTDPKPSVPGYGRCNYRFSIGPTHTLAPGSSKPESFLGPFTTHKIYRSADYRDGLSNTVGVSERLQGDWTAGTTKAGGDYYLTSPANPSAREASAAIAVCSASPPDAKVESRGGESWFLSGLHFTNFNHCVTPNSNMIHCALDDEIEPMHQRLIHAGVIPPTSSHRGGVNVGMMDGSVKFINDAIQLSVWRALGTRSSGD